MQNYVIIKSKIKSYNKSIEVSSDKSLSIRSVLFASQAVGISKIQNLLYSEDVRASLKAIKNLGIKFKKKKNYIEIYGKGLNGFKLNRNKTIDAGNSGTLGRLILGLLVKSKKKVRITGDKSLSRRDFSRITDPLKLFGVSFKNKSSGLPLDVYGTDFPRPINYLENRGSAQCKSAVMLAALNTPGVTKIKAAKSRDHTEKFFNFLKIPMKIKKEKYYDYIEVKGQKNFQGFNYTIPGDISSAAFFIVLTLLTKNSKLIIKNVNINNSRIGIIKILNKMNAGIKIKNKRIYKGEEIGDILIKYKNNLRSINCDKSLNSSAIDEFLVIFLVAAKAKGVSIFKNLSELNKKESPRLDVATKFLTMLGVKIKKENNNIKIYGDTSLNLKGKYVIKNFLKDHRIFMMSCIAALSFGGWWKIHDKDSIKTSFPKFLKIIKNLGASMK